MGEFGKRAAAGHVRAVGGTGEFDKSAAPSADLATAIAVVKSGKLPPWTKVGPLRLAFMMLGAAAGFWFLILPHGGDIARDYRLAGTWQPAYDMRVVDPTCTNYNFVFTDCSATIKSLAEPDGPPLRIGFMMGFTSGGGEIMTAVRSTRDPTAVTLDYPAETELTNRALTLLVMAFGLAMVFLAGVGSLLRGRYKGGAAHRALIAGLAELKARVESANADPRAAA